MTDQATVAVVGLGQMGAPMARRLVGAGRTVLGVDTDPAVVAAAAADCVKPAASVAEAARSSDTMILMLPHSGIVDAVAAEIAAVTGEGRCRRIVDMSSSEPSRTRQLAARLVRSGVELVDAPVSGGVGAAVAGTLTVMVGGSAEQFAVVERLLDPVGSSIVHVGAVGSGHALKALNNLMSACSMVITAEAMTVAARFGIDPETALAVVNSASGRSGSTEAKFPRFVLPRRFDSGFTAALMDKDVGIATRLAADVGVRTTLADAVGARWHELVGQLPAGADHTEIIRPLEAEYGVEIRPGTQAPSSSPSD
ncbi:NAD(P)-dependent oxidoreductase [Pseudonocardia pini]|uniref:NAD(P)-dependent oxidoreductase n=1 Tax=Pseudonocardia pini TaxID=2758030 RepID=UPI0015F09FD3|nr:NAD(P)-dependent oxidoreductase [Pseudonocardia pini]